MKTQDKQKFHQSTIEELDTQLKKLSGELVSSHQQVKLGRSKNTKVAKNIRHQITIIKTIIREKQLTKSVGSK